MNLMLLGLVLISLVPLASADTVVYAGYDDGTTDVCVSAGDEGVDPSSGECAAAGGPVHVIGEVSAGARFGGVSACLLVDENGNVHPNCEACEILHDTHFLSGARSRVLDLDCSIGPAASAAV